MSNIPFEEIQVAAAAIANARGMRRGVPEIKNILEVIEPIKGGKLYREVMEDAEAALEAVNDYRVSRS